MAEVERKVNPLLRKAIEEKRLIRLRYKDRERIVEPHDYGIRKDNVMLLAWQTEGSSSNKLPGWRWMEVDMISDIELLNQTFRGGRPAPSGVHQEWQEVFIRARAA